MNGAQPPPANGASNAPPAANGQQQQQPVRRRRQRPGADPLRKPRKPLQNIARPITSLTEMHANRKESVTKAEKDNAPTPQVLKDEYLREGAQVFPLVMTRRQLNDIRYHVMRLQSKARVNIQDASEFVAPVKLHRRDPRAGPSGAGSHFDEEADKEDLEEMKQREQMEQQKEERRQAKELRDSKIAPTGMKKTPAFQKKTEQKYRTGDTPEEIKRGQLRYEEALPWHLEDFENKQTWTGAYESELSETHVLLAPTDPNNPHGGKIQLTPIERWYRFNAKSNAKGDSEEKLDKMHAGSENSKRAKKEALREVEKLPGFLQSFQRKQLLRNIEEEDRQKSKQLRTRIGGGHDDEGRIRRQVADRENFVKRELDGDDIDFNLEEDFADDEEGLNGLFEGEEEEVKEAQDKLKRDQLAAAAFDRVDDKVDQEDFEEQMLAELRGEEKGTRKQLAKREKQYDYMDSDNENPYMTSSDSDTDSETERQRAKEEEEKKAAEQNGKAPELKGPDSSNVPSGGSAKGSGANTPAGNHTPSGSFKSKKRPGSPNLSEASGNESSRKKVKKNKDKLKNRIAIAGSPAGSPGSSRAGSPAAPTKPAIPSAREIYESLPPGGMTIQALIAKFKGRVDKTNSQLFIKLVKAVSSFDKQKSWLTPLESMPSEEQINTFMGGNKAA